MRAFRHYYFTINLVNTCFSAITALITGRYIWFPILFCTIGIIAGVLFFNNFCRSQYYSYYNLGYTKQRLILTTFALNLVPGFLILLIITLFS